MSFAPTLTERLNRARADLRVGLGVVLTGPDFSALVVATEALDETRLADLRGLGPLVLVITARRAETLRARAYDGDLARIEVPADKGLEWLCAVADPQDDLRVPMKGPFVTLRGPGAETVIATGMKDADGIGLVPGGGYLVSSWPGEIYHVSEDGVVTLMIDTKADGILQNDLSVFGDVVIVPNWEPGTVTAWKIVGE